MKETEKNSIRGKKNRARGMRFEAKVRAELENLGWSVSKWMNNIEFKEDENEEKL